MCEGCVALANAFEELGTTEPTKVFPILELADLQKYVSQKRGFAQTTKSVETNDIQLLACERVIHICNEIEHHIEYLEEYYERLKDALSKLTG